MVGRRPARVRALTATGLLLRPSCQTGLSGPGRTKAIADTGGPPPFLRAGWNALPLFPLVALPVLLGGYDLAHGQSERVPTIADSSSWSRAQAALETTPSDVATVSVIARDATVTEGSDAVFLFDRTGSTTGSLTVGVDIHGHTKVMSAATRTLAANPGPSPDTTVTFGEGEGEATLTLTTEADRVNEGDGEFSVTIAASSNYTIFGTGSATVLVEDDDIPEVTLRWNSPAMTLRDNVWVGSMVEGQAIDVEVVCSGNSLAPEGPLANRRFPLRHQELLNHPFQGYDFDSTRRYDCGGQLSANKNSNTRYVGPANGRIEIDLFPQVLDSDDLPGSSASSGSVCGGGDIRFCPKFTLGAVKSARIEVLNRNPTITVEAVDDEVNEGEPARFRLTRIWTSDWLSAANLIGSSTTVDYTTTAVGDYVTSPPSGRLTFESTITEVTVEIPTVHDGVAGEDGMVTFELQRGSPQTQSGNLGGHYEVYDSLEGITPPGGNSRVASVRILDRDGSPSTGVELSVEPSEVAERAGATTVAVTAALNGATRDAATPVTVSVDSKTAVAGTDFAVVADFTLTIPANEFSKTETFRLEPTRDALDEEDETVAVSGTTTVPEFSVTEATVTITDDNEPGLILSVTTLQVAEGDNGRYMVSLATQPMGPVTVELWCPPDAPLVLETEMLAFDSTNWNKPQEVPLHARQDGDSEDHTVMVEHIASGTGYDGIAMAMAVTIMDDDTMHPSPRAWLARFGRTVAEQVLEAVEDRVSAPRLPGVEGRLAGHGLGRAPHDLARESGGGQGGTSGGVAERSWAGAGPAGRHDAPHQGSEGLTGRDIVAGTAFALTEGSEAGGLTSLWGRGAVSRFEGREGDLLVEGEVTTGLAGMDYTRGPWTAGLVASLSRGEGTHQGPGGAVDVGAPFAGLYPWASHRLSENLALWGVAGYGEGALTLRRPNTASARVDTEMRLAAMGARGTLATPAESGGPDLAVTTDALSLHMSSDAAPEVPASKSEVIRLRLGLEGSWHGLEVADGALVPGLEIGVRQDGGDAETGTGVHAGAALAWSDPSSGLSAEARAQGLLTHEDNDFRERTYAGTLAWRARPDSDLGPSLTLRQGGGDAPWGGMDTLLERGVAPAHAGGDESRQLDATLGYGMPLAQGRFVGAPELGFALSGSSRTLHVGWGAGLARRDDVALDLALTALRREHAREGDREHAIHVELRARF